MKNNIWQIKDHFYNISFAFKDSVTNTILVWVNVQVGKCPVGRCPCWLHYHRLYPIWNNWAVKIIIYLFIFFFLPKIIENLRKFGYPTRWKILSLKSYVQYVKF